MKIGSVFVKKLKKGEDVMIFQRRLLPLEKEAIDKLLNGSFHVHLNPRRKKKTPMADVEDIGRIVHVPDPSLPIV